MGKGSFKYAWVLDKLRLNVNVVSLLISLCGNLRLPNTMSPSLMLLDIVISSRRWTVLNQNTQVPDLRRSKKKSPLP